MSSEANRPSALLPAAPVLAAGEGPFSEDSVQGSLRASAKLLASPPGSSVTPFAEQLTSARRALGAATEEPRLFEPDPWSDDFEEISYDELRSSLFGQFPPPSAFDCQTASSLLSRSRSSLSRLKKLSLRPTDKSRQSRSRPSVAPRKSSYRSDEVSDETALILSFPHPPSCRGEFSYPPRQRPTEAAPVEDISSVFYSGDPFGKPESRAEAASDELQDISQSATVYRRSEGPRISVDTLHRGPSTSPLESSSSAKPFTRPLKRLRTLTKTSLFRPSRKPTQEVGDGWPTEPLPEPISDFATVSINHVLPEFNFDEIDFSPVFTDHELDTSSVFTEPEPQPPPSPPPRTPSTSCQEPLTRFVPRLRIAPYQFVDPRTLTDSPIAPSARPTTQTATPLPPSPSWLSRNVKDLESHARIDTPILYIRPPPSPPLHILPRSALPIRTSREDRDSLLGLHSPDSPVSAYSSTSSVTLFSSRPNSFLSPYRYLRPPSRTRLSVILHHSATSDRKSIHSFISRASIAYDQGLSVSAPSAERPQSPQLNVLLLSSQQSPGTRDQLTPLSLFNSDNPILSLPSRPGSLIAPQPEEPRPQYQVFVPSRRASLASTRDSLPPPAFFLALLENLIASPNNSEMPLNVYDKPSDTVDWGDEVDYSGIEWFKDPPPRQAPPPPASENYVPQPGVIEQNEMFDYALKSAPNVLYSRFKQYGQLGVLAWCSEFGELIDSLKTLGFEGNMFVSTREQALKTCEEILKLPMKIEMQIIVMYLSSQVARLRRFLDAGGEWHDYPEPQFPLDWRQGPAPSS